MSNFRFELISSHKYGDGHYAWASAIDEKKRMRIQVGTLENDYYLYSEDLGNSWIRTEGENNPSLNYKQLKDGSYISLAFNNLVVGHINIKQDKIPCIIKIVKAECMDDILSGNINVDFALIDIPDLSVGYGDSGGYHCSVVDHGLIQLEDGSLIATMYGQFKSDIVKVDYFDEYDFYQYRSWCIKSNDNGKTWEFLSTIADVQTHPIHTEAEGYCEPDLLHLGDGHILAVIRTMGHEVYSPMYACHSYDSGKTWDKPIEIHKDGVFPRVIQTENGCIVCTSGKVGIFLLASEDGYKWQDAFYISDNDGKWDKGPSGYHCLLEVAPNEILVVFDNTEDKISEFKSPEMRRKLFINRYKVIKE